MPFRAHPVVYRLIVALSDIEPRIWRRLLIPGRMTLREFHDALQAAMGWENLHLYEFRIRGASCGSNGGEVTFDADRKPRRLTVDELGLMPGDWIEYLYDFGDGWLHEIEVEEVLPESEGQSHPVCLGGRGACPEEDSGGPMEHLHRMRRRRSGRARGKPFNVLTVNARLKKMVAPSVRS